MTAFPNIYSWVGGGVQIITGWAQRVNGSYSLFNIENVWIPFGPMSCWDFCCRRWVSVPGLFQHLLALLLPWKPCLAYLTPLSDDITCEVCPFTRQTTHFQYLTWRLSKTVCGGGVIRKELCSATCMARHLSCNRHVQRAYWEFDLIKMSVYFLSISSWMICVHNIPSLDIKW